MHGTEETEANTVMRREIEEIKATLAEVLRRLPVPSEQVPSEEVSAAPFGDDDAMAA